MFGDKRFCNIRIGMYSGRYVVTFERGSDCTYCVFKTLEDVSAFLTDFVNEVIE